MKALYFYYIHFFSLPAVLMVDFAWFHIMCVCLYACVWFGVTIPKFVCKLLAFCGLVREVEPRRRGRFSGKVRVAKLLVLFQSMILTHIDVITVKF